MKRATAGTFTREAPILGGLEGDLRAALAMSGEPTRAPLDAYASALLTEAPNVIEFVSRREFMNAQSIYKYARSYQVLRDYFELRCPVCNKGGTGEGQPGDCMPFEKPRSRAYLEAETLLVWSREYEDDVCPKCGGTKAEFIEDGLMKGYSSVHLIVGQRAGKTTTAAYIGCYLEHRLLCTGHRFGGLWKYFGMEPGDTFENTFLAASDVQSKGTIWAKYSGYRKNAPWFQRYVAWIKDQERAQPKFGMQPWQYHEGKGFIENEHPDIRMLTNSLNSNSNTQAGRGRIFAVADELARMQQTTSALGAAEIYETLMASLRTVKSRVRQLGLPTWIGTMGSITSPIRSDDVAMRLLKQAPSIPGMYAAKYATWEFNPYEPRSGFDEDFKRDPVRAARNFGAQPAGAEHPLLPDVAAWVSHSLDRKMKPSVTFEEYTRSSPKGNKYIAVRPQEIAMAQDDRPRFVAWDAGKNFDAFTGAGGYGELTFLPDGTERKTTRCEWIMRVVPTHGVEVWFDSVLDVTRALLNCVSSIARMEFDHWQSTHIIQLVRELGIEAEETYTNHEDFTRWRVDCFGGRFVMPWPDKSDYDSSQPLFTWTRPPISLSPVAAAVYELTRLERDPETGRIRNPRKGEERGANSDDAANAVVKLHTMVQRFGYTQKYYDNSRAAKAHRTKEEGGALSPTIVRTSAGALRGQGRNW